jgi:hypothetical protein
MRGARAARALPRRGRRLDPAPLDASNHQMPNWRRPFPRRGRPPAAVVARIHAQAARGRVVFTDKARRELRACGFHADDALELLAGLQVEDLDRSQASSRGPEMMHVFKPHAGGMRLYVKVVLRMACVVISLHEDRNGDDEEAT